MLRTLVQFTLWNLFLLSCGTRFCLGQEFLQGRVLSSIDSIPLTYVNIGVLGKAIGTASDTTGYFTLTLNSQLQSDSIRVSMIGFKSKTLLASEFKKLLEKEQQRIYLEPDIVQMDAVHISNKKLQRRTLGNTSKSRSYTIGFASNHLGNALGLRIKIKKPTRILAFHTYVVKNTYPRAKFRLNIYAMHASIPGASLLKENILVETTLKEGPLTIDLRPYNIYVGQDILLALEWIEDLGVHDLQFSAALFGNPAFFRSASQDVWEKSSTFTLGFSIDVEQ